MTKPKHKRPSRVRELVLESMETCLKEAEKAGPGHHRRTWKNLIPIFSQTKDVENKAWYICQTSHDQFLDSMKRRIAAYKESGTFLFLLHEDLQTQGLYTDKSL